MDTEEKEKKQGKDTQEKKKKQEKDTEAAALKPKFSKDNFEKEKAAAQDPLGHDLAHYVSVTSMSKSEKSLKVKHETPGTGTRDEAKVNLTHFEPLTLIGEGMQTFADQRLGWMATNRDVAKDLKKHRTTLVQVGSVTMNQAQTDQQGKMIIMKRLASLPFHTLRVKWRQSFNFPMYTPKIVFGILVRYGRIISIGSLAPNAMFVVFHHDYHACKAVMSPLVGFNYCPLLIRWWYLERYKFPVTDPSDVKREDLVVSDGRLERNCKRHIAQIKREFWRKAAALSYDVSTFRS